jgi:hypothetical protein
MAAQEDLQAAQFPVLRSGFGQDKNDSVSQVALRAIMSIQIQKQLKMIKKHKKKTECGHYSGISYAQAQMYI